MVPLHAFMTKNFNDDKFYSLPGPDVIVTTNARNSQIGALCQSWIFINLSTMFVSVSMSIHHLSSLHRGLLGARSREGLRRWIRHSRPWRVHLSLCKNI